MLYFLIICGVGLLTQIAVCYIYDNIKPCAILFLKNSLGFIFLLYGGKINEGVFGMKNMVKFLGIITIVVIIGFLTTSCLTFDTNVNTSLDGVWSRGDIIITISGNSGVFTQINPNTNWHRVQSNGEIRIGDLKFRNINQTGHLRWSMQDLSFNHNVFTIAGWENATISMDRNGNTIRVITGGGVSNPDNVYTRVR